MRILVTGGAGFIGSHTVDALVAPDAARSLDSRRSVGRQAPAGESARALLPDRSARRGRGARRRRARAARGHCASGGADGRAALGRRSGLRRAGERGRVPQPDGSGARARAHARGLFLDRRRDLRRAGDLSRATKIIRCVRSVPTASPSWRPRHTCFSTRSQYGIDYAGAALRQCLRPAPGSARRGGRGRDFLRAHSRRTAGDDLWRRRADARLRFRRRRGARQHRGGRTRNVSGRDQHRHRRRDQRQRALLDARARIADVTDRAPEYGPARAGEQRRSVISPARAANELAMAPAGGAGRRPGPDLRLFRDRATR